MKKIIIILLFIAVKLFSAVPTNIPIPDDRKELERLYVAFVKMYYKESDSHKITLSKLSNQIKENENVVNQLRKAVDLISELQKKRTDFFQSYIIFSGGYSLENNSPAIGVGWSGIFIEKLLFGLEARFPSYAGLIFGIRL